VKIVDPGEGGGLVVGRRYDITCRAWGSRPPASLTWYLGVTRLGREYTVPGTWGSRPPASLTWYLVGVEFHAFVIFCLWRIKLL